MSHRKIEYQPNAKLARAAEAYRGKWVVIVRNEPGPFAGCCR
jgi:hypothetical protein